jgi:hypothetical protein
MSTRDFLAANHFVCASGQRLETPLETHEFRDLISVVFWG